MDMVATIDAMKKAGCSDEQIVAFIRNYAIDKQAADEARKEKARAGNAERQRRKREKDNVCHAVTERDEPLHAVTGRDTPLEVSPKVSPKDNISNPLPNPLPNPPKTARGAEILRERREFAEKLWRVMPKRRGDSFKPFEKAVLGALAGGADPKDITDGAVAYAAAEAGRDGQYRKGAAVWVNQHCWTADWTPQEQETATIHPFAAERQNAERMQEYARKKGLM